MGRPPLRIGTAGKINVTETSPGRFRARCRFRDEDGAVRFVVRYGTSRNNAEAELKDSLKRRRPPVAAADVSPTTRVQVLAAAWLERAKAAGNRALSTQERYEWIIDRIIRPRIGELQVQEATVDRLDRFIGDVKDAHGAATARTTRTVLSMILGDAVRRGALPTNPCRDLSTIPKNTAPAKALTPDEERKLLRRLDKDELTRVHDLPDLVRFMLGTGVRLGEACALREEDVDLGSGTASIVATVTHSGRQERTKSKAGMRVIALPADVVALLRRRMDDPRIRTDVALFCSPLGRLRDPSNTSSDLRRALDRAGFKHVHSHTFRKTAATKMDAAGMTAREIADHLGHSMVSMTQDVYLGRGVASTKAAQALASP